jgi:uncharacterized membrane protein YgcG
MRATVRSDIPSIMTRKAPISRGSPVPNNEYTLGGLVAIPLLIVVLLVVASYPVVAASVVVSGLLVGKVLQVGLAAYARRTADRIRELSVPGVGTVRFRFVPR